MSVVVLGSPGPVILYDAAGVAMAVSNGVAIPVGTSALLVAGSDGTVSRFLRTAADGTVRVDPSGTTTQPVSGTVIANQGTAAGLAAAWPVKHTDGTNIMPTADVAARALFSRITDGTNFLAMLDVAARAGFVKVTDGTNIQPTGDVAARALFVKQTDGTNVMPTGDAIARSVFQQISDATNGPVTVKPASTPAAATDKPLVVTMHPNTASVPVTFTAANSRSGVSSAFLTLGGGSSGTLNPMRATAYVEPTTAAQRSIVSASVNDTAAGTGARTVRITYYDNTGAGPLTETVTLNGTTAVNTVATNIRFIEEMEVVTVGSLAANVGVISLFTGLAGAGTVIGSIGTANILTGVGDNVTLWAHHYVAASYKCDLAVTSVSVQSGGAPTSARFFVRYIQPLTANAAEVLVGEVLLANGQYQRSFDFHPTVLGFARLTAYSVPGVNNATVSIAFDWQETPV